MNKRAAVIYISGIAILLLGVTGYYAASFLNQRPDSATFDGARAYADVQTQLSFGPRTPGSAGHAHIREWLRVELESAGWTVKVHESSRMDKPIYNLIAMRNENPARVILAAHYDTRFVADNDPDKSKRSQPVPGANDGASGVAILLELARTLPNDIPDTWLVFFDTEDNGRIEGWDWILGSRAFVQEVPVNPQAVVVVDMVGDADLNLYYEVNSNKELRGEIWAVAESLGYGDAFIKREKFSMLDDHTAFLEAGIPAIDIIDFDYPYWHTTEDTADKVSAESLYKVGNTLWHWLAAKVRHE